jgi:phospholipid/cholesterol/gamma-HCH transport system ATP-binding protein
MASAFSIADRITMLDQGEVVAIGTPNEIRENPHPRVQRFLNRTPDEEPIDVQGYLRSLTQPSS